MGNQDGGRPDDNKLVPTPLEQQLARERIKQQNLDRESIELQNKKNRALIRLLEKLAPAGKEEEPADARGKAEAKRPQPQPEQVQVETPTENQQAASTQRGIKKHEYTQFILNQWDEGERNREVIHRRFVEELLPASKRRTDEEARELFRQWWKNAAKHRPEMWSQSRIGAS